MRTNYSLANLLLCTTDTHRAAHSLPRFTALSKSACVLMLWLGLALGAYAQNRTIKGVVRDASGAGLPAVSVYVKNTTTGTITDSEGNYEISAANGATLIFQSVGYLNQEIVVGEAASYDITLEEDIKALSEIVVVGYGTQAKKDLTGSISTISAENLNPGAITNPLQQLNGRAAGVTINQVGSEPGVAPSIRIRGVASLTGSSDPLVVVDGIQSNLSILNQIPPSEILSVDLLKDGSATAIYGSRANAGVLVVTTKRGQEGKTSVEYNFTGSMDVIARKLDVLSAEQYRAAAAARGINPSYDGGGNTNWLDQITRTGYTQNHNLAFGGGNKNFNYRASLTAILQDGIIINSGFQNYIGRLQATQRALNDKLTLTYQLNVSTQQSKFNGPGVVGAAINARPTDPIYQADGSYFIDSDVFSYLNPYARAREIIDGNTLNNLFGSVRADYEIIEGLTASVFGSWRKTNELSGVYQSPLTTIQDARQFNGFARRGTNAGDEKLFNFIVNYRRNFGDHSLDFTFVNEWQRQTFEGIAAQGRGFVNDLTTFNNLASSDPTQFRQGDVSSYKNEATLAAFLGRVNYSYKDKYLLTASIRRDGSSRFGANNRWANFPAVSVAWRLSNEEFFKSLNLFNEFKIRAGYASTGNQAGIGPYQALEVASGAGTAFFNGASIPVFAIQRNANPDLRWESRNMFNVGIDFLMFNNRLSATIDYYNSTTSNLLYNYQVPNPPFPVTTILANAGKLSNQGLEIALSYQAVKSKDLNVTLAGNFTTNRTKVMELGGSFRGFDVRTDTVGWGGVDVGGVAFQDLSYLIVGKPIGSLFVYSSAGVNDQGVQQYDDLNGDGIIDVGRQSRDRYIAGQILPKFTWAFTPTVTYKNFDFNMVLRGAHGHKIYNNQRANMSLLSRLGRNNVLTDALNTGINSFSNISNTWVEDGGFARLENITVGYRFNTQSWKLVESMRVSFTATNLFVITGYKGIDPEVNLTGGGGAGIDNGIYPRVRSFAFNLNVMLK